MCFIFAAIAGGLWSLIAAIAFVFTGNLLGKLIPVLNRFAMPGAIMGGALGIALCPQLIDAIDLHGRFPRGGFGVLAA